MRGILIAATIASLFSNCSESTTSKAVARVPLPAIDSSLADQFDGQKAYKHVETLVGIGPRPPASEGYAKQLAYLESELSAVGWTTLRQEFRAATPDGPIDFINLIARHSTAPTAPESLPVVIGGHIDTKKLPFHFVGANDAGSSTGVMLELARVLNTDPASAAKVELVFFDGEEAFRPGITPRDGLYGSKYFAHELSTRASWPSFGIVLDIVGDPNHPFYFNPEAPASVKDAVKRIAPEIGFHPSLTVAPGQIIDDHVPLMATGLDCFHLIGDFQAMRYWHQAGDTMETISPKALNQVGKLTLRLLAEPNLLESREAP